jgi:pyridoxine 4-dehydrogenase
MVARALPGGTFTMAEDLTVTRMGYGAMQLAGPGVFGPPKDRDAAVAVLREAVELGITHIDTADFYGPHITNQIIKEALLEAYRFRRHLYYAACDLSLSNPASYSAGER